MARYRNDPRIIQARFDSVCAETGKQIKKGESCLYYPASKSVYALDSSQANTFNSESFDMSIEDSICDAYGF